MKTKYFLVLVSLLCLLHSPAIMAQVQVDSLKQITSITSSYPYWSPDGSQFVFESDMAGSWDIFIANADGSGIQRLTDNKVLDRFPSWSPDGKTIAFISDRDGDFEIYTMRTDGSRQTQVTDNNTYEIHPYWDKNSNIVYNSLVLGERVYDIRRINPSGSNIEVLLKDDDLNSYAQTSPDGLHIVFDKWYENQQSNGEIFLIDNQGNNLRRITNTDDERYDGYPTWHTDSRTVIYSSEVDDVFQLFAADITEGSIRQLTTGEPSKQRANVHPDGDKLLVNLNTDGNINVYQYDIAQKEDGSFGDLVTDSLKKLTNPEFAYPHFSPDGKRIVYQSNVTGNWEIFLMNVDGSGKKQITRNKYNDTQPSWSPDGASIAFVSDRDGDQEIFMMDTLGYKPVQLTDNELRDIHPYWYPDSEKIIFNSSGADNKLKIKVISVEDKSIETIIEDEYVNSYASVSPAGDLITFVKWLDEGSNGEIFSYNLDTGEEKRLTTNERFDGYPAWSNDGRFIIYSGVEENTFRLFLMDPETGEERMLETDEDYLVRANWSPDGDKILVNRHINGDVIIYLMHLSEKN